MMYINWLLLIIATFIFIFNIPFGYWRANVSKFSLQWYLAIHLPVVVVVLIRFFADIGWNWLSFLLFILSFFLGQYAGTRLYQRQEKKNPDCLSSCMFMDIYKKC